MSDANLAVLAQIAESSWGVLPGTPAFKKSRFTKDTLNYAKETVVSAELRDDRQVPDLLQVGFSALGGYEFELSAAQEFDLLFSCALFATPTTVSLTALSVVMSSGPKTIVGAASSFSGLKVGNKIKIAATGGANDNKIFTITVVSGDTSTITVAETLAAYTGTATFTAKIWRNGVVQNSMALEKKLASASFMLFSGMMVNTFRLNLEAKKIATGSVDFMGRGATVSTTSADADTTYTAQTTGPVLNCSSNIGTILQDGAALTVGIRQMTININNNLRPLAVIGQSNLFGVGSGRCEVTGTMSIYFADNTMLNKFIAHTASSFSMSMTDANGGGIAIDMPKVQFSTGKTDNPGINTDIMLEVTFQAILDPVTGYQIQISEF